MLALFFPLITFYLCSQIQFYLVNKTIIIGCFIFSIQYFLFVFSNSVLFTMRLNLWHTKSAKWQREHRNSESVSKIGKPQIDSNVSLSNSPTLKKRLSPELIIVNYYFKKLLILMSCKLLVMETVFPSYLFLFVW